MSNGVVIPDSLEVLRAINVIRGTDEPSGLKTDEALRIAVVSAAAQIGILRSSLDASRRESDGLRKAFEGEIAGNIAMRNKFGANPGETMHDFVARLADGQVELRERREEAKAHQKFFDDVAYALGVPMRLSAPKGHRKTMEQLVAMIQATRDECGIVAHSAFARDVADAIGLSWDHGKNLGDLAEALRVALGRPNNDASLRDARLCIVSQERDNRDLTNTITAIEKFTGYDKANTNKPLLEWMKEWEDRRLADREDIRRLARESYLKRKELWWALKGMSEDLGARAVLGRIDKAMMLLDEEKIAYEKEDGPF